MQEDQYELEAILSYTVSSVPTWTTELELDCLKKVEKNAFCLIVPKATEFSSSVLEQSLTVTEVQYSICSLKKKRNCKAVSSNVALLQSISHL